MEGLFKAPVILRCDACHAAISPAVVRVSEENERLAMADLPVSAGVYVQIDGICPACGGQIQRDKEAQELANLIDFEEYRVETDLVADRIAGFGERLSGGGLDSYAVAMVTMAFATGRIDPNDFVIWKGGRK